MFWFSIAQHLKDEEMNFFHLLLIETMINKVFGTFSSGLLWLFAIVIKVTVQRLQMLSDFFLFGIKICSSSISAREEKI